MKTAKRLGFAPLLLLLLAMALYDIQSNGAPMGNTNAPGELTCNRSGCHTGNALNSGAATLSVDLGNAQQYTPGTIYPVTVEVTETGKERFGFQIMAMNDDDSTNAGTFIITDSTRTKVIAGINQYAGRSYATYKFPGTAAFSPGVGKWTLLWQAPATTSSPVTFYTAAAVANNDGTDQGEFIYTKTLTLPANPNAAPDQLQPLSFSTVYPNPSQGLLTIAYESSGKGPANFHLQNLASQHIIQLPTRRDPPGQNKFTTDLRGQVPAGTYLLWISQGPKSHSHKLILTP